MKKKIYVTSVRLVVKNLFCIDVTADVAMDNLALFTAQNMDNFKHRWIIWAVQADCPVTEAESV